MGEYDIFLCHTKQSKNYEADQTVYGLYKVLTDEGHRVFFDRISLPGCSIEYCVHAASTTQLLIAVCDDKFPSTWCCKEIGAALNAGVPVQTVFAADKFRWAEVGKPAWWAKDLELQEFFSKGMDAFVQGTFALPAIEYHRDPVYEEAAIRNLVDVVAKLVVPSPLAFEVDGPGEARSPRKWSFGRGREAARKWRAKAVAARDQAGLLLARMRIGVAVAMALGLFCVIWLYCSSGSVCRAPAGIENAAVPSCREGPSIGADTICTAACKTGYEPSVMSLMCSRSGLLPFACREKACIAPRSIANAEGATCKEGANIEAGGTCTPACQAGYLPNVTSLACSRGELTPPSFECTLSSFNWYINDMSVEGLEVRGPAAVDH